MLRSDWFRIAKVLLITSVLLTTFVLRPTACDDYPIPGSPNCTSRWGGPNFMYWVVRISRLLSKERQLREDLATGNIVTPKWILTACSPVDSILASQDYQQLEIFVTVNNFSSAKANYSAGIFPFGGSRPTDGCIFGIWSIASHKNFTKLGCGGLNDEVDAWPDKMKDNLVILEITDPGITINDVTGTQIPRMPFPYDMGILMRQLDFLNGDPLSRCIVPRWLPQEPVASNSNIYPPTTFENSGFHYRVAPFNNECAPRVCETTYDSFKSEIVGEKELFMRKCVETNMYSSGFEIMCLVRMEEWQQEPKWTVVYDVARKHTDWGSGDCHDGWRHITLGAPVVYDGTVVAIVTKCTDYYTMATTIASMRNRLLKLLKSSFMDIIFAMDGSRPNL